MNGARVEPVFHPSAPPAIPGTPSHLHPSFQATPYSSPQSPSPGVQNVPPMMYSVPVTNQPQVTPTGPPPPTAALRPMQQPPPAPSLNEVHLTEDRQRVRCPYCQASIITAVKYQTGTMTHIAALAVFVVCCPLAWLPYAMDMCKDVDHSCPNCGRAIGKFKRFN